MLQRRETLAPCRLPACQVQEQRGTHPRFGEAVDSAWRREVERLVEEGHRVSTRPLCLLSPSADVITLTVHNL